MILIFLFLMVVVSVAGWLILNPPANYEDNTIGGVKDIVWDIVRRKQNWQIIAAKERDGELSMTFTRNIVSLFPHQVIAITTNLETNEIECRSNLKFVFKDDYEQSNTKTHSFADRTLSHALYEYHDSLTSKEKDNLIF